jgi:hypothetical protein
MASAYLFLSTRKAIQHKFTSYEPSHCTLSTHEDLFVIRSTVTITTVPYQAIIFLFTKIFAVHLDIRSWMGNSLSILILTRVAWVLIFACSTTYIVKAVQWQETLRLLIFDCLVLNEQNIMAKPLSSRYGVRSYSRHYTKCSFSKSHRAQRLQQWFYEPYEKVLRDIPSLRENRPFEYACVMLPSGEWALMLMRYAVLRLSVWNYHTMSRKFLGRIYLNFSTVMMVSFTHVPNLRTSSGLTNACKHCSIINCITFPY